MLVLLVPLVAAPLSRAANPVVLTTSGWVSGRQDLCSAVLSFTTLVAGGRLRWTPVPTQLSTGPPGPTCRTQLLRLGSSGSSHPSRFRPGKGSGVRAGPGALSVLRYTGPGYRVPHTARVSAGEGQHHAEWRPGERRPARGEQRGLSLPQRVRAGRTAAAGSPPRPLLDTRRRLHSRLGPRPGQLQRCMGNPVSVFRCTGRCSTSRTTWWW